MLRQSAGYKCIIQKIEKCDSSDSELEGLIDIASRLFRRKPKPRPHKPRREISSDSAEVPARKRRRIPRREISSDSSEVPARKRRRIPRRAISSDSSSNKKPRRVLPAPRNRSKSGIRSYTETHNIRPTVTGKVVNWLGKYGFVTNDEYRRDAFVHASSIRDNCMITNIDGEIEWKYKLVPGKCVEFKMTFRDGKEHGVNVRGEGVDIARKDDYKAWTELYPQENSSVWVETSNRISTLV